MSYLLYLDDMRLPKSSMKDIAFSYGTGVSQLYFRNYELFSDGNIPKNGEWMVVRSYNEFINCIKKYGMPEIISFDHDLSDSHIEYFFQNGGHKNPPDPLQANFKEKTGYDCAKWLIDLCIKNNLKMPECYIHSHNPVGKQNIKSIINSFLKSRN